MLKNVSSQYKTLLEHYDVKILQKNNDKSDFNKIYNAIYTQKIKYPPFYKPHQIYFAVINKNTDKIVGGCKLRVNNIKTVTKTPLYNGDLNNCANEISAEISHLFSLVPNDSFFLLKFALYTFCLEQNVNYAFILIENSIFRLIKQKGISLIKKITNDSAKANRHFKINSKYYLYKIFPEYNILKQVYLIQNELKNCFNQILL
jgi:hypothetical protein